LESLGEGLDSNPALAVSLDDIRGVSGIFSTTMDGMSVINKFSGTQMITKEQE
jgi:hypothetical protein